MYLISLYFDKQSNKTLQKYIHAIADKTGNTFMIDHKVPPHITIAAIEARDINIVVQEFKKLKNSIHAGEIQFVSVGQLFPFVMYVTPILNEYLSDIQNKVYDTIKNIPEISVSKYYKPYSWLPHVTVGKTLNKEQMEIAFGIMRDNFILFNATVTEIGLSKVNPHQDIERWRL